jgi:HSP20 family protein
MYPIIRRRHHWEVPEHFTASTPDVEHFWRSFLEGPEGWFTMSYPVDVREEGDKLVVEAELPGFTKDQVHVSIDDNVLHIRAERETRESSGVRHLTERKVNRVARDILLPVGVDESKADARMVDGVLTMKAPKKKGAAEKGIPVK